MIAVIEGGKSYAIYARFDELTGHKVEVGQNAQLGGLNDNDLVIPENS